MPIISRFFKQLPLVHFSRFTSFWFFDIIHENIFTFLIALAWYIVFDALIGMGMQNKGSQHQFLSYVLLFDWLLVLRFVAQLHQYLIKIIIRPTNKSLELSLKYDFYCWIMYNICFIYINWWLKSEELSRPCWRKGKIPRNIWSKCAGPNAQHCSKNCTDAKPPSRTWPTQIQNCHACTLSVTGWLALMRA
jgi:hypothetical protein